MAARRQSSLLASKRIQSQLDSEEETPGRANKAKTAKSPRNLSSKRVSKQESDASGGADDTADSPPAPRRPVKRAKREKPGPRSASASDLHRRLFSIADSASAPTPSPCHVPLRHHNVGYHRPLLLHGELGKRGRADLLAWYDQVNTNRSMPWRKPFIDPKEYCDAQELCQALTLRAYEVFISEIMLQQTRVKTVIEYWNRWMEKWPTIYHLAKANQDDVMSAWRGLGYYSRCKRILEACIKIVEHQDWRGLMPQDAKELEAHIPGVGPYTAGAISSIVFGRAAPMVDGNVLRVLSRQLGLLADTKTDKAIIDLIWACARSLVETVALEATPDGEEAGEPRPSDAPGRWGQALMELGSTVCTPSPNCSACPVTTTCWAYAEGRALAGAQGLCPSSSNVPMQALDIEDICQLCEPYSDVAAEEAPARAPAKKSKQATMSSFFAPSLKTKKDETKSQEELSPEALKIIVSHAQKFPVKLVKKALREQETLVCAVRRASDGYYLLQRRPEKGRYVSYIHHETKFLSLSRSARWHVGVPKSHSAGVKRQYCGSQEEAGPRIRHRSLRPERRLRCSEKATVRSGTCRRDRQRSLGFFAPQVDDARSCVPAAQPSRSASDQRTSASALGGGGSSRGRDDGDRNAAVLENCSRGSIMISGQLRRRAP